jgi:predicted permease
LVVPFYQLYPGYKQWRNGAKSLHEFRVWKLQDVVISDVRRSLLTLFGAVLAILLVACLNLAGLMAARAMRRSREIALRSALGASAAQLLRLIVCEGLLLALGGGALAMGVAAVTSKLLLHNTPLAIPGLYAEPDPWKLGLIVILVSLISTALFSTLPASMFLRRSSREMRLGSQSVGQVASHTQISRALMVLQMALAMVLISTASMLLGTFVKLQSIPSGVDPKHLTIFQVTLKGSRYSGSRSTERFVSTVIDELSQSPGVERVAAIHGLPMDSGLNDQGYPAGRKEMETTLEFRPVTSGYFAAMGIPLIMGRDISDSDRADTEPVVVIGETTAKKWWPGRSPIGESIHYGDKRDRRIVGVVADVHTHSLVESEGLLVYAPMTQVSDELTSALNGWFPISFALRTSAHLDTGGVIRQAVEQADPGIPVAKISTMQSVIDDTIQEPRFFSVLAVAFSLFAVGLTVIGLFGLLSYQVTQRTREIGVRMALGADRNMILRAFLGRGLLVSIFGIVTGSAASWTIRPVVANLLADSGLDVTTGTQHLMISSVQASMVSVVAILLAAAAASWLPASRAASVEPMQALRAE